MTADVIACPVPPSTSATVAGIAAASAAIAGLSVRAGRHRTSAVTSRLRGRWGTRRAGTIDPHAARRTPFRTATCPSHSTPAADTGPAVAAADRDEPSQCILHRNGEHVSAPAARELDARMELPPQRWSADRLQPCRDIVVGLRRHASCRRPHHHPARHPRGLELHLPGPDLVVAASARPNAAHVSSAVTGRSRATVPRRLSIVSARSATTLSARPRPAIAPR